MRPVSTVPRVIWLTAAWIVLAAVAVARMGGSLGFWVWASVIGAIILAGYLAGCAWGFAMAVLANLLGTVSVLADLAPPAVVELAAASIVVPGALVVARRSCGRARQVLETRGITAADTNRLLERRQQALGEEQRDLEREVGQLGKIYELTKRLLSTLDREDAARCLADALTSAFPQAQFRLCSVQASEGELDLEATLQLRADGIHSEAVTAADRWLLQHLAQEPVIWSALPMVGVRGQAEIDTPEELRHATAFPFVTNTILQGFLIATGLQADEIERCGILVSQFALVVRRIRLYERVQDLAIRDGLTGLYVRRHFIGRLQEEITRAVSHGHPVTFLMIDIDHFKKINDTYGHLVGDAVLRELCALLRTQVRDVDLIGRYGGEEFGVALLETGVVQGQAAAERIRHAVEEMVFRACDERLTVTVSIGVAAFPWDSADAQELVEHADAAMYKAKLSGRNRACIFGA